MLADRQDHLSFNCLSKTGLEGVTISQCHRLGGQGRDPNISILFNPSRLCTIVSLLGSLNGQYDLMCVCSAIPHHHCEYSPFLSDPEKMVECLRDLKMCPKLN